MSTGTSRFSEQVLDGFLYTYQEPEQEFSPGWSRSLMILAILVTPLGGYNLCCIGGRCRMQSRPKSRQGKGKERKGKARLTSSGRSVRMKRNHGIATRRWQWAWPSGASRGRPTPFLLCTFYATYAHTLALFRSRGFTYTPAFRTFSPPARATCNLKLLSYILHYTGRFTLWRIKASIGTSTNRNFWILIIHFC